MICPICKESGARRSRRRGIADVLVSTVGVYPWRCHHCHGRFHARLMPLSHSFQAHCPVCGNMELMRISPDYVSSPMAFLWRLLRIPAFRCEPCRHKYFSILPYREVPDETGNMVSSD